MCGGYSTEFYTAVNTQREEGHMPKSTTAATDTQDEPLVKADAELSDAQKKEKDVALKLSYSTAQTEVRLAHLAEFNKIRVRVMAEQGFEWAPEPTEKEKAYAEFERLLRENPDFAEKVQSIEEARLAEEEEAGRPVEDEGEATPAVNDPTYPTPKG